MAKVFWKSEKLMKGFLADNLIFFGMGILQTPCNGL